MDDNDIRAATTAARRETATWMSSLNEDQLASQSLCSRWTVKMVGAHLVVATSASVPSFLVAAVRHRGNFHRANNALAQEMARKPTPEIVRLLEKNAGRRLSNPGTGVRGPLTDILVHSGDMKRPLGIAHDPPLDLVRTALEFLTGRGAVGFVRKGFLDDVRLTATDVDFTWGSGAEVTGRAADLMMVACGRDAALPELTGAGVEVLRDRTDG